MKKNKLICPCCNEDKEQERIKILIRQMYAEGAEINFEWICQTMSIGYTRWACDDCLKRKKAIASDPRKMNFCVTPKYLAYFDEEKTCFDCKKEFIFSKEEQQYWFETLHFWHDSIPDRCKACRKKIRHQKELVKRLSALLENLDKNNRETLLEIAKIYTEMNKEEKAKQYTTWAKKAKPQNNNMHPDILTYNDKQSPSDKEICDLLASEISRHLPEAENKIWHAHPVWFLDGNPIVGYSKLKGPVRLLFWSGQSFEEEGLKNEGKFKAAEKRYTSADQVNLKDLERWLKKACEIQWDYKNIVKRKGRLERLK